MARMSKAQRDARRWLANERAYAAVPAPTVAATVVVGQVGQKKGPCRLCWREGLDPPAEGDLLVGQKFDESVCTYHTWRGYVCEMHLENFREYRFL